ncbi:hypothetical protein SDC9_126048 [bioreactor metagenome]|uniref:Uncharacterized protein n=1 Tax=bioreactor metagenome TaxID=1076179 RepID=A0A645CQN7_9ZZZZ
MPLQQGLEFEAGSFPCEIAPRLLLQQIDPSPGFGHMAPMVGVNLGIQEDAELAVAEVAHRIQSIVAVAELVPQIEVGVEEVKRGISACRHGGQAGDAQRHVSRSGARRKYQSNTHEVEWLWFRTHGGPPGEPGSGSNNNL